MNGEYFCYVLRFFTEIQVWHYVKFICMNHIASESQICGLFESLLNREHVQCRYCQIIG